MSPFKESTLLNNQSPKKRGLHPLTNQILKAKSAYWSLNWQMSVSKESIQIKCITKNSSNSRNNSNYERNTF